MREPDGGERGRAVFEEVMDFTLTKQGVSVGFRVIRVGIDFLVLAAGGDVGHIGAVTLGSKNEIVSSFRAGHMESVVTDLIYRKLNGAVPDGLAVAAGIHVDGITKEQIDMVMAMCEEGAKRIAEGLKIYSGGYQNG